MGDGAGGRGCWRCGFHFNPRISGEPTRGKRTFPFCLLAASVRVANQEAARCRLINYMEDGEEVGGAAKGRRGGGGTNLPTCCHFNAGGHVGLN